MTKTICTCDCCSKGISGLRNDGDTIFVPFDAGRCHHLCVSCVNRNISNMITGLYPKESQEVIRMLMGGRPNAEDLKLKDEAKKSMVKASFLGGGQTLKPKEEL